MRHTKRPSQTSMQKQCDKFNQLFHTGSPIRVWTGLREGEGRITAVRWPAQILSGHTAGVYTEDFGFVSLSHVAGV